VLFLRRIAVNNGNNDGVDRCVLPTENLLGAGSLLNRKNRITDAGVDAVDGKDVPAAQFSFEIQLLDEEQLPVLQGRMFLRGDNRSCDFAEHHGDWMFDEGSG